ncbi:hypothetical protein PGTUg99_035715 [Puccinia graminis f. sp. tritici]|uniref:Uncharacterized protein n=1 Tax=Puccinia graminis f. sp. tritici TaxID=56615 RepID=A0A5B0RY29_PUCGR|nr:hypothetical protein PGTUg99_035715 [Puccinia graminis f. sp. tritici]
MNFSKGTIISQLLILIQIVVVLCPCPIHPDAGGKHFKTYRTPCTTTSIDPFYDYLDNGNWADTVENKCDGENTHVQYTCKACNKLYEETEKCQLCRETLYDLFRYTDP